MKKTEWLTRNSINIERTSSCSYFDNCTCITFSRTRSPSFLLCWFFVGLEAAIFLLGVGAASTSSPGTWLLLLLVLLLFFVLPSGSCGIYDDFTASIPMSHHHICRLQKMNTRTWWTKWTCLKLEWRFSKSLISRLSSLKLIHLMRFWWGLITPTSSTSSLITTSKR